MKNANLRKNATWQDIPQIVMFELTNQCNFSCIMCPNKLMTRKKGIMDKRTFEKGLTACADAGVEHIKLYTTGESLLHPNFLEFFTLADRYPFKTIMVSTNGKLLTKELVEKLLQSEKIKIQISFSGWNTKSYELRYRGGNFQEIISKIQMIIDQITIKGRSPEILSINGVVSRWGPTIKLCKDFLKKNFSLQDSQLHIHRLHNWEEVITGSSSPPSQKIPHKRYCHIANTRMGILYDGKVTACGCLDVDGSLIIGDILTQSISEIRTGEQFSTFKQALNTGEVTHLMCARCKSLKVLA